MFSTIKPPPLSASSSAMKNIPIKLCVQVRAWPRGPKKKNTDPGNRSVLRVDSCLNELCI